MIQLIEQLLNGTQLGVMLFLMAAGLTLIFGIMNLINLAHGSLYMVGAYVAAATFAATGSFLLGLAVAILAAIVVGVTIEVVVFRTLYARDHLDQVLATFGLILFFNEIVRILWGSTALYMRVPAFLDGRVEILPGSPYPMYRLAIIAVGLLVALLLYLLIARTRIGMLIRAGAANRVMLGALGVNVTVLYTLVFALGAALSALAGVMAGPIFTVESGMGASGLILAFVVILIGGIGSYAVGILAFHGIGNGFFHFVAAFLAAAVAALAIGFVSLRTTGVYFIMITLAFSQMVYFLGVSLNQYGGDDGLNISRHSDFGSALDLDHPVILYYFVFASLLLFLFLGNRIVHSRFGVLLQGVRSNERRMIALGFPTFRYKLAAFVMAGAVCGVAGALFANLTLFVSPSIMHWTRSGEIIMMVILGGIASLIGPVFGAAAYLILESVLSRLTEHWQAVLGPILILVVLFSKTGLYGIFALPRRRSG